MKSIIKLIFLFTFLSVSLQGQILNGTVLNQDGQPLFGATIQWEGENTGTVADEEGRFSLPHKADTTNLIINYVGYQEIVIEVFPDENDLILTVDGVSELMEIEVAAKLRDTYISSISSINMETITGAEFKKAACCSLADCFETNAAVDVSYSDAITGARELEMLGLRGIYTQMLIEKRPALAGLGSPLALEFLPGTWLEGISISKGAGSVQSGYNAITGQINSELKKPFKDHPLFVNIFANASGRAETNIHLNKEFNSEWSSGLLLHGSYHNRDVDRNDDGFLDIPHRKILNGMYRLYYRGASLRSQINVHLINDQRNGGQIADPSTPIGSIYEVEQRNKRAEVFGKLGYIFEKPNTSLGLIYSLAHHKLDNRYGNRFHQGDQNNVYASLNYNTILGTTDHQIFAGASFLYDDYNEQLDDSDFSRIERVPGVYFEYMKCNSTEETTNFGDKIGLVAGIRVDHHNTYDWLVSPRINLKYNVSQGSVFRLAAGRGYRTPSVIAENVSLMASSRTINVLEDPKMESAWNYGVNFTHDFIIKNKEGQFAVDFYRTDFTDQIVIDLDQGHTEALIYNLDGKSYSNSFLTMVSMEVAPRLDVKLAYKFNDVKIEFMDGLAEKTFVAKHRGLVSLDYETEKETWAFNTTLQLVGKQRFPENKSLPAELKQDHTGFSPAYPLVNLQITRKFKTLELYAGSENIGNYKQTNPIIDSEDPFGEYFDATQIYAPVLGVKAYLGLRWWIAKKE